MKQYRVTMEVKGPAWMDKVKVATVKSELDCTPESAANIAKKDASLTFNIPERDITVTDVVEEF